MNNLRTFFDWRQNNQHNNTLHIGTQHDDPQNIETKSVTPLSKTPLNIQTHITMTQYEEHVLFVSSQIYY